MHTGVRAWIREAKLSSVRLWLVGLPLVECLHQRIYRTSAAALAMGSAVLSTKHLVSKILHSTAAPLVSHLQRWQSVSQGVHKTWRAKHQLALGLPKEGNCLRELIAAGMLAKRKA